MSLSIPCAHCGGKLAVTTPAWEEALEHTAHAMHAQHLTKHVSPHLAFAVFVGTGALTLVKKFAVTYYRCGDCKRLHHG